MPPELREVVAEWMECLRRGLLWGQDDPLFPRTRIAVGASRQFEVAGLERAHWSNAAAIRKVFKQASAAAGLSYFNPHSFRRTLAQLASRNCGNAEQLKAWSQNLGHESVMTTLTSYGEVPAGRQAETMRAFVEGRHQANA